MQHHSALALQPDLFPDAPIDSEDLAFECWADGLLTAAAVGPRDVAMGEWMSLIWDVVDDAPEAEGMPAPLQSAFSVAWADVVEIMRSNPQSFVPRFAGLEDELSGAMMWSQGFHAGISLRPAAWEALTADPRHFDCLMPILLLSLEDAELHGVLQLPAPRRRKDLARIRQNCADGVAAAVTGIYRYWRGREKAVGRNAQCPCGSGRKYKKCCLR